MFQRLASGLTVRTVMAPVALAGPLSLLPPTTVLGQRVVGIKGKTATGIRVPAVPEVLYVRASGTPLPVEAVEAALPELIGTWAFRYEWARHHGRRARHHPGLSGQGDPPDGGRRGQAATAAPSGGGSSGGGSLFREGSRRRSLTNPLTCSNSETPSSLPLFKDRALPLGPPDD